MGTHIEVIDASNKLICHRKRSLQAPKEVIRVVKIFFLNQKSNIGIPSLCVEESAAGRGVTFRPKVGQIVT